MLIVCGHESVCLSMGQVSQDIDVALLVTVGETYMNMNVEKRMLYVVVLS